MYHTAFSGAHVNHIEDKEDTYSALYLAAAKGNTNLVYLLLHYGADVHFSTLSFNTVLHAAADRGAADVVKILLSR